MQPEGRGGHDIDLVVQGLQQRLDDLPAGLDHRRVFIATYLRTTQSVGAAIERQYFEDPAWVARWDVAFAGLFMVAHDADLAGGEVPRPWRLAFAADPGLPVIVHLLLGMNAHINYDLAPAMLAVIDETEFDDPELLDRRRRDHERIDRILASRVAAEDIMLGGRRTVLDQLLKPLNRLSARRFLRESRQKVWINLAELQSARAQGPAMYARRLGELELLSAAKIADLLAPGQVLLRLAVTGFGVTLPPP